MVARLRTNVLRREEKGFGPVSFPRILMAGLSGTFATLALSRLGFVFGCLSGFFVTIAVVALTQPIQGTPLAQYLSKVLRGIIVLRALKEKDGDDDKAVSPITELLITAARVEVGEGILNCDEIFNVQEEETDDGHAPVSDLVFFRDISDLGSQGLQVVENPFNT